MKNPQRGSAVVWLIIIIILLVSAFGVYIYLQKSQYIQTSSASSSASIGQINQTSQVSDEQSIVSTVTAMLNAERSATTLQDAENVLTNYASQEAIQQFQTGISKIPASSMAAMQSWILQIDHAYPDPTSLQFNIVINGDMATATAALPNTTSTSTRTLNGKAVGTMTATYQNSISLPLQKENGQWKVNKIIVASKGVGVSNN